MWWFGRRLPWGDRYDAYGAIVGAAVFVVTGFVLAHGVAGWLLAFAIGTGVMNLASFVMRRVRGIPRRSRHP